MAVGLWRERTIRKLARRGDVERLADLALRVIRENVSRELADLEQHSRAGRSHGLSDDDLRRRLRGLDSLDAKRAAKYLVDRDYDLDGRSADWLARRIGQLRTKKKSDVGIAFPTSRP